MRQQSTQQIHFSIPSTDPFWNPQQPEQTERYLRSLLPESSSGFSGTQIIALTQLVRLYSLQDNTTEATALLNLALARLDELPEEEKLRALAHCHIEQGRNYCLQMLPAKGLECFRRAWELAGKTKLNSVAVDAAYMLSITLPSKLGATWLKHATELAESTDLAPLWLSTLYMASGWRAFEAHDFSKAQTFFTNALAVMSVQDEKTRLRICWAQARTMRAQGRAEEALVLLQELQLLEQLSAGESGHILLEIAECLSLSNDKVKAKTFFNSAWEMLQKDKWFADNNGHELTRILKCAKAQV